MNMSEVLIYKKPETGNTKRKLDDEQEESSNKRPKQTQHEELSIFEVKDLITDAEYVNHDSETVCKIHKFNTTDIYEIITYFMQHRTSNDAFYIVNLSEIVRIINLWKTLLPRVIPHFAIKANPDPMIAKVWANAGGSFDCASKEEIIQVLALGVDPKNIIYANPVKQNEYISFARARNVDLLVFDSKTELKKIDMLHPNSKLVMRIKVDDSGSVCRFNSKFGCFDEEIEDLLKFAKMLELDVCGVSFHLGSNLQKSGFFDIAIKKSREVINVAEKIGHTCNLLDIGGGFSLNGSGISFQETAKEINNALDKYFGDILDRIKVISEPGRMICNTSHTLVTSIIGIRSKGVGQNKEFIYTINESIYQSFNCLIFDHANPEVLPYDERDEEARYKTSLVGKSCDSGDSLKHDVMLPELSIGDFVYIPNFGAYTRAASSTFNGFKVANVHYITTD
jgi:ornithine decarboxylase